jgi:hypothetical protein
VGGNIGERQARQAGLGDRVFKAGRRRDGDRVPASAQA